MSGNTSSSVLHPNLSSYNPELPLRLYCFIYGQGSFIFTSFIIMKIIILLPLSFFILYIGLQQWKSKLSSSSAVTSHSDCFAYNIVMIEIVGLCGCFLCFFGIITETHNILTVGFYLFSFTWSGELFFSVLTCVERYMAVVHPIIYLSLRKQRWIRIRMITIGGIWLLCFVNMALVMIETVCLVLSFCFVVTSLPVIFFCNVSILQVLIRPCPGERCGRGSRVKMRRAFYSVVVILGALTMRFVFSLIWSVLEASEQVDTCFLMTSDVWFDLPSTLVLPLLFLHRAGKSVCR